MKEIIQDLFELRSQMIDSGFKEGAIVMVSFDHLIAKAQREKKYQDELRSFLRTTQVDD